MNLSSINIIATLKIQFVERLGLYYVCAFKWDTPEIFETLKVPHQQKDGEQLNKMIHNGLTCF